MAQSARTSRLACAQCDAVLTGRRGKKYCSIHCKNAYHRDMRLRNQPVTAKIDQFLHRNRTILYEVWIDARSRKFFVQKSKLYKKGFRFKSYTSSYLNNQGKTYFYVYDFRWMEFSTDQVMVIKNE
ncbi:MAG: hypothetical protein OEQ53_14340 [Saprospiraceae bacterium]|nr:hypothetical protein [Saprospiraceae bacterium]